MTIEHQFLTEASELHAEVLARHPDAIGDTPHVTHARCVLEPAWRRPGELRALRDGGSLRALLLLSEVSTDPYSRPDRELVFVADPDDPPRDWLLAELRSMESEFGDNTFANVSHVYGVEDVFVAAGFGINSVLLTGTVGDAANALRGTVRTDLGRLGLGVRPARAEDLGSIKMSRDRFFDNHPEFGLGDRNLTGEQRARLDEAVVADLDSRRQLECVWVIVENEEFRGWFGLSPTFDHPVYGAFAGIDIMFDESIQGLGVARTAYERMVERAARLSVLTLRGRTSHPAVAHLARQMGRTVQTFRLARSGPECVFVIP